MLDGLDSYYGPGASIPLADNEYNFFTSSLIFELACS